MGHQARRGAHKMWFLILPFLGAAAGAYIGRENPAFMISMMAVMVLIIIVGLGDPALAVQLLGFIILAVIGLVILYNIIPILLFMLGACIALAFIIVVFAGIFRLIGV